MAATISHPEIGKVQGKPGDGVTQFLGIQYGSVKDRLAAPELVERYSGVVDGTKLGPVSQSPHQAIDMEYSFIQHTLPKAEGLEWSDLESLTLSITVPAGAEAKKLPVFVFVHGGGFFIGSGSWPHYDQARIVKLSAEAGMPMIGITINYRLGLSGLLTSEELRNAGYPGNNALRDQQTAFRWIKKFIGGFGGDPNNVTFAGESAGGVAGTFHLHSKEPLFNHLLSMSGTSLLMKPLPAVVHESIYQNVLKAFKLEDKSPSDRIQAIIDMPWDKMTASLPPTVEFMPLIDGDLLPEALTFDSLSSSAQELLPGLQWCKSLLVGSCQFDGSIMAFRLAGRQPSLAQNFATSVQKSLPAPTASKLLSAYGIDPSASDDASLKPILTFITDISWVGPTYAFADAWAKAGNEALVYFFNEPNPWEGQFKDEATHVLDIAFLFQNFNEFLDEAPKAVAVGLAKDVIQFANGKAPWEAWKGEGPGAKVYKAGKGGKGGSFVSSAELEETKRRQRLNEVAGEAGLDGLANAWGNFLLGK